VVAIAGSSLAVPELHLLHSLDLLLQLQNSVQQSFCSRWAAWNIDVDGDNAVTPSDHGVGIMVITAAVGTAAHGDDPARLRHLIIHLPKGWSHLVGDGSSYDDAVGLTRAGSEHHTETIHVVAGRCKVHHLHRTASKAESQRPDRALASPVEKVIDAGQSVFCLVAGVHLERRIRLPLHHLASRLCALDTHWHKADIFILLVLSEAGSRRHRD